jgi:L-lactate dehydrogenase complex protein LldG
VSQPSAARDVMLGRVRDALAGATPPPPVIRDYRTSTGEDLEVFLDRLRDYDATVLRSSTDELAATVRERLAERKVHRLVVPAGIPDDWLIGADVLGVEVLGDDPPLSNSALDGSDGVITTCALAIAGTGTIVLDGSAGMGRRALSLVPDYHLCVVRVDQLVSSFPEAIARLDPRRPLTFISGPSATVDIEMVRVSGVHGPRWLDVLVVSSS